MVTVKYHHDRVIISGEDVHGNKRTLYLGYEDWLNSSHSVRGNLVIKFGGNSYEFKGYSNEKS